MTSLQYTIKRARRRHTLNRMIHAAGIGASLGLGICVVLIALERLALGGFDLSWQFYTIIAGIGLLLGAIWPLLRVSDLADIALQLDRALRLQDRIATAHAMSVAPVAVAAMRTGPRYDGAFAELVKRDADRVAGVIDVRNVVPIRITGIWGAAVIGVLAFVAAFMFLPTLAWGEERMTLRERERIAQELHEQREQERVELLTSIDEAVAEAGADAAVDARTREQLEALERLSQQLRAAEGTEEDVENLRDESAAVMNELSKSLAEHSLREQLAAEKAAERFGALDTPDTPMSAEEFTEALKRGDFGRAADSLEELLERRDQLSQQERRELAEHLQELSQQLDNAGQREQQELSERAAQLEQALREQGLDQETIEQLLEGLPRSEEDITRELLDGQVDEDIARRLARELERLQEQRDIEQQAQQDAQAVNEALRDAADEFDSDVAEPSASEPGDDMQDSADPSDSPADPGDPDAQQPDEPTQDDPGQDQPAQDEPDSSQQQGTDEQPEQTQEQREAAEQQRGTEQDQTREQATDEGTEGEAAEPSDAPDAEGDAAQPDPNAEGELDESAPGAGEDPDGAPVAQEQPGDRSPGDALREMQQRRQAAEDRRQSSERMRQRARGMTQDQQQQGDSSAVDEQGHPTALPRGGEGAGDSSPPRPDDAPAADPLEAEIDDLDLRDFDGDPGELIAEWMDSESPREGTPQTRRVETEQRVRQAQEIAERAVNEAAVPSRYHERIRRYFNRLNETVDRATSGAGQDNSQP